MADYEEQARPNGYQHKYYAVVRNNDGSIDKIANPEWTFVSVSGTGADGNALTKQIMCSLTSYDYKIHLDANGDYTIYVNNVDINNLERATSSDPDAGDIYAKDKMKALDKYVARRTFEIDIDFAEGEEHMHTVGASKFTSVFEDLNKAQLEYASGDANAKGSKGEDLQYQYYKLESGSYYLSDNYQLTHDLVVPAGNIVDLCLDGKTIDLNGFSIVVEDGATLNICDCNDSGNSYKRSVNEDGTATYTLDKTTTNRFYNNCEYVYNGVIYDSTNTSSNTDQLSVKSAIVAGAKSKVNMYQGTIDISGRDAVIDASSCADGSIYLNNAFIGKTDKSEGYVKLGNTNITYGTDYYSTYTNAKSASDIYLTSSTNKPKVTFDDYSKMYAPISIKAASEDATYMISSDYDKYVTCGILPTDVFSIDNTSLIFAYGNDNALYAAPESATIDFAITQDSEYGKSYPAGETYNTDSAYKVVKYLLGSNPKIHYESITNPLYDLSLNVSGSREQQATSDFDDLTETVVSNGVIVDSESCSNVQSGTYTLKNALVATKEGTYYEDGYDENGEFKMIEKTGLLDVSYRFNCKFDSFDALVNHVQN